MNTPLNPEAPTAYRARVGQKRAYLTSAEAVAYERGFNDFPSQPWGPCAGPAMDGYRDAASALTEQLSVREERRAVEIVS